MPHFHRDPETGQFLSAGESQYEDVEIWTFQKSIRQKTGDIQSGNLPSDIQSEFGGLELFDISDALDNLDEVGIVLDVSWQAGIRIVEQLGNNDDGYIRAALELSFDSDPQAVAITPVNSQYDLIDDQSNLTATDGLSATDEDPVTDNRDLLTRPLQVFGDARADDDTNGGETSTSRQHDSARGPPPGDWRVDVRDDVYLNGAVEHEADTALQWTVMAVGQVAIGVREE